MVRPAVLLTTFAFTALSPAPADAAYLYWSRVGVQTASEPTCFSFARAVARDTLGNVRFTPGVEVAGTQGGSYAAMTCVGRGANNRAMAVIMVMGDDQAAAIRLRDDLAARIQRERRID